MKGYPSTLSWSTEHRLESELASLEAELHHHVDAVLQDIEPEPLRKQVGAIAFEENEAIPGRRRRPKVEPAFLVDRIYRASGRDADRRDELLRFSVIVTAYYDIVDDLADGDVAPDRETEVLLTIQTLVPLLGRRLARFDDDAVDYWSERAMALVEAPLAEISTDPAPGAYLQMVERQADLYGFLTGLAATVADAEPSVVESAERIGRTYYEYEQLLLDHRQAAADGEAWNAWNLLPEEQALARIRERHDEFCEAANALPDEQATLLTSLADVDFETLERDG